MSLHSFSYVAIRYVHDFVAAESLNVGVVLYSPSAGFLDAKLMERRTHRLSEAFRGFSPSAHRAALSELRSSLLFMRERGHGLQAGLFEDRAQDAGVILRTLWPDKGTRYTFGETRYGKTDDPKASLEKLYERFVESQMPPLIPDDKAKDERIWRRIEKPLRERVPLHRLERRMVHTPHGPVDLAHTFEHGKLDVFQPLSFDLSDAESITRKAQTWFGRAHSLTSTSNIGSVIYIVGGPKNESHLVTFTQALHLLEESPVSLYRVDQLEGLLTQAESILGKRY